MKRVLHKAKWVLAEESLLFRAAQEESHAHYYGRSLQCYQHHPGFCLRAGHDTVLACSGGAVDDYLNTYLSVYSKHTITEYSVFLGKLTIMRRLGVRLRMGRAGYR
jgi:hypothetical protein